MRDLKMRPIKSERSALGWAIAGSLALAGCVDTAAELGAPRAGAAAQRQRAATRPGVSPRGASVALTSMEGAPEEAMSRFAQIFTRTVESRDIATTKDADAAYRVRGYLTAYSGGEGTTRFAYVWDVFERNGRRAQRLTDEVAVKGTGDPWANLDEKALTEVAARGADDLAAFLSNTPEAIAAAAVGDVGVTVATASHAAPASPQASPRPLGFAEAR